MKNNPTPDARGPGAFLLPRALGLIHRGGPGWFWANFGLMIVQAALPLVTIWLIKLIVDQAAAAVGGDPAARSRVWASIALAAGAALLTAWARSLAAYVAESQAELLADRMSALTHQKAREVDLAYYEDHRYFDALYRAQREAPLRPARIIANLVAAGQGIAMLLGVAALLAYLEWGLAAILLLAAAPAAIARARFSRRAFVWSRERTAIERRAHYYDWLLSSDVQAAENRAFDLGKTFADRFVAERRVLRDEKLGLARSRAGWGAAAQSFETILVFGAFAVVAWNAINGRQTLGDLVLFIQAFQRGLGALRQALSGVAGLHEDNLFLADLFAFLDLQPRVTEPPDPKPAPGPVREGIRIEGLDFTYPGASRPALSEVSISIAPGEIVAVVGPNGAGKSTLAKLLLRLYDPDRGAIRLDGVDLRELKLEDLRRRVAALLQESSHYHLSAGANIALGDVGARPDPERLETAAARSGARDFIASLAGGYDAPLGKWLEPGAEPSAGQWRKLGLARALYRDADVLVLDEPTSAMDPAAEADFIHQLRELAATKAVMIVSQRFSTVRAADRVYGLERGRVVEQGRPDQLLTGGGFFARMRDLQAGPGEVEP